ncbi:putative glycoside hydrolase [Hyphomonas sp.]|uniref:putative glycoside hydrolase n=1 Tax=Hyphomonas sp. TaxID=87 RepID=UPI0039E4E4AE
MSRNRAWIIGLRRTRSCSPIDDGQSPVDFTDGKARNYMRESNADIELAVTLKPDISGRVEIGMRCEGEDCAAYQVLSAADAKAGEWTDIRVSLICFTGLDLDSVTSPFSLRVAGPGTVAVSDVRFAEDADSKETCLGE